MDNCVSGVGVVGLDTFELLKKFFEVLHYCALVTDRDTELLDVALLMIRVIRSMSGLEAVVSKKSAGESVFVDWPDFTDHLSQAKTVVRV